MGGKEGGRGYPVSYTHLSELATPTSENVRKGYLMGKYGATPELEIEEVE